jgi:hypothetical protein
MARPKNTIRTVTITFSTTERIRDLLDELLREQTYGRNRAEVVDRLLSEALRSRMEPERLGKKRRKRTT